MRYGGRGIKVCREWQDFETFMRDVSSLPGFNTGLSLDRKNNESGYSLTNCRWATASQQSRNQRKTIRVQWNGETIALADLADRYGINRNTLYSRVRLKGWTICRALGVAA
jgi:hypothetical protein